MSGEKTYTVEEVWKVWEGESFGDVWRLRGSFVFGDVRGPTLSITRLLFFETILFAIGI